VSITVSGLSSGIDYDTMITKLMAVESQPLTALKTKETNTNAKLTALGTVKSALSTFQATMQGLSYATTYQNINSSVADATVATANASSIAKTGTYSLEVTKLAQAQKLVAAGKDSATNTIGNGVISFDFGTISGATLDDTTKKYSGATFTSAGTGVKTVTIDAANNSLSGIREAINNAAIGVTATIVNDGSGSPYRLALTVQNSGKANSLKISTTGDSALSALMNNDPAGTQGFQENATAQNAELKVDGIAVTKASNSVSDVIAGVTISLLKTNKDSATSITVLRDTSKVTEAVNSFVSAYNEVSKTMKDLVAYNATTKVGAVLNGEGTIRDIQTQLRKVLSSAVTGGTNTLTMLPQAGVSFQKDGTLAIDSTKLQSALTNYPNDFASLFGSNGSATDSLASFVSSTSSSKPGTYALNISQLATQGSIVGTSAAGLNLTSSNNTLQVKLDGVTATITLNAATYGSAAALATEIQSKINSAASFTAVGSGAKVSVSDDGTLTITSNRYGSASNASITGGNGQANLNMGTGASIAVGVDVAGSINGVAATGSGQLLTGASGDTNGIRVSITGGSLGTRGSVSYSQGYAYQFDSLLTSILGESGSIATRIDGINTTLADMSKQETTWNGRLTAMEKRYRTQFSALETLLSNMNSTSTYLTQQLDSLAALRNQKN